MDRRVDTRMTHQPFHLVCEQECLFSPERDDRVNAITSTFNMKMFMANAIENPGACIYMDISLPVRIFRPCSAIIKRRRNPVKTHAFKSHSQAQRYEFDETWFVFGLESSCCGQLAIVRRKSWNERVRVWGVVSGCASCAVRLCGCEKQDGLLAAWGLCGCMLIHVCLRVKQEKPNCLACVPCRDGPVH